MMNTILINGLWQGALIAAIALSVTIFLPKGHAATRYSVWFTALLALVIVPIASTFQPAPTLGALPVEHTTAVPSLVTAKAASVSGAWLLGMWLAGVTFCLFRLALSYVRIDRIVRNAVLAPELGSGVMISDDVAVPIAARIFKPAIVLPSRLVASLDRTDVDIIVRHERAHIRRMDVAGNMLQRVIEALLFFNPWVYIIGRELVKEREAACDDWAVYATGEADRYASCLARLAQSARASHTPLLTPSAIGSRRMLVGRIARLLNGKGTRLKINYVVLGASTMAFAVLAVLLQTSNGVAAIGNDVATNLPANCYHDVKVLNAAMPDISKADYRPKVTANALVTVAADGKPTTARIVTSSGSAAIDNATIKAAMTSTYSPAMSNCKLKTGQYLFHVDTGP